LCPSAGVVTGSLPTTDEGAGMIRKSGRISSASSNEFDSVRLRPAIIRSNIDDGFGAQRHFVHASVWLL
jgi:hypothetical protein